MIFNQEQVRRAFGIYKELAARGSVPDSESRFYFADEGVAGLLDEFAHEVDCAVIHAGGRLHLVPLVGHSAFHVSNEHIKRVYLSARATNADVYLMYAAVLVLVGEFYDSYQSSEPTRDFLSVEAWLESMNRLIQALEEIPGEELAGIESQQEYNWSAIRDKWAALDDLNESARRQDRRTASRLAFLNTTGGFLEDQGLVELIGPGELALTEKARVIVERYYMDMESNRGIMEFMSSLENGERKL